VFEDGVSKGVGCLLSSFDPLLYEVFIELEMSDDISRKLRILTIIPSPSIKTTM
jgi:hypothetical protein